MSKVLVVAIAAAVAAVSMASAGFARTQDESAARDKLDVSVGDVVRVPGAQIGCRVTRLASYGNRVFLDCRRAGRLTGSYGTYFGLREALVVRFLDEKKAKVVLHARHQGEVTRCT
jgi:hypothetical protein